MKKKWIKIAALTMACTMMAASLSGCGARAEATNQEIENGETIIVTESSIPSDGEDEIASTEVVGGTETETFAGAEDDNIVLYAEIGTAQYIGQDDKTFENMDVAFAATEDIPLFNGRGQEVGYLKEGGHVTVTESVPTNDWARFENPIAGTGYDYLYIMKSTFPDEDVVIVTADDLKQRIIDAMNNRAYELPTVLDAPTDDMEVFECRMEKEYSNDLDVNYWINQNFYINDNAHRLLGLYMTYCVECQEDGDGIICKVYYKDLHEAFVEDFSK